LLPRSVSPRFAILRTTRVVRPPTLGRCMTLRPPTTLGCSARARPSRGGPSPARLAAVSPPAARRRPSMPSRCSAPLSLAGGALPTIVPRRADNAARPHRKTS
jgi:hypothetical protein